MASINARDFYAEIIRPSWAPPGWLFGPVWMILYTLMGVAVWHVWLQRGFQLSRLPIILFFIHLIPNALWSWVFFSWRLGALSFVTIVVLWILIGILIGFFCRRSHLGGILLVPYFL